MSNLFCTAYQGSTFIALVPGIKAKFYWPHSALNESVTNPIPIELVRHPDDPSKWLPALSLQELMEIGRKYDLHHRFKMMGAERIETWKDACLSADVILFASWVIERLMEQRHYRASQSTNDNEPEIIEAKCDTKTDTAEKRAGFKNLYDVAKFIREQLELHQKQKAEQRIYKALLKKFPIPDHLEAGDKAILNLAIDQVMDIVSEELIHPFRGLKDPNLQIVKAINRNYGITTEILNDPELTVKAPRIDNAQLGQAVREGKA